MIKINHISKTFKIYRRRSGILRDVMGWAQEGRDFELVRSLKDIHLEVPKGSIHGIIGMNGAGKSTLLKILTGVLDPSTGTLELKGRVAALLELGTGFHSELTGRENVILNAGLLGLSHQEIQSKIADIQSFCELGEFFDRPVKIYSSGMYVRLAFSFAVTVNPDVLIIDEALSVGDAYFQQKCLKKIHSFKKSGTTILFVSHDLSAVKLLCEQVTLLSKGEVVYSGTPMKAMDLYNELLAEKKNSELQIAAKSAGIHVSEKISSHESGSKEAEILDVKVETEDGREAQAFSAGSIAKFQVRCRINADSMDGLTCGILLRDRLGYDIFGTNSSYLHAVVGVLSKSQEICFNFTIVMNLGGGDYTVTIALHSDQNHIDNNYHWIERALVIQVIPQNDFHHIGVAKLPIDCKLSYPSNK